MTSHIAAQRPEPREKPSLIRTVLGAAFALGVAVVGLAWLAAHAHTKTSPSSTARREAAQVQAGWSLQAGTTDPSFSSPTTPQPARTVFLVDTEDQAVQLRLLGDWQGISARASTALDDIILVGGEADAFVEAVEQGGAPNPLLLQQGATRVVDLRAPKDNIVVPVIARTARALLLVGTGSGSAL